MVAARLLAAIAPADLDRSFGGDGIVEVRGLSGADLISGGRGKDSLGGGPARDVVQQNPVRPRPVR